MNKSIFVLGGSGNTGEKMCVPMFFEELRDLPNMIPSLKNTGFYIAGSIDRRYGKDGN